eukprot:11684095-Karenia_brevis.AAC.1
MQNLNNQPIVPSKVQDSAVVVADTEQLELSNPWQPFPLPEGVCQENDEAAAAGVVGRPNPCNTGGDQ